MNGAHVPWRLLSWNLNVRTACSPAKPALLRSFDWDVIALQEVDPETFDLLGKELAAQGIYRLDNQRRAEHDYGCALFIRAEHDVVNRGLVEDLPWPERGVWADIQLESQGLVRVVSFHSPNAAGQGAEAKMAAYEAMHRFVRARPAPMVLAMDANSGWDCWPGDDDATWQERVAEHGDEIWRWDRLLLAPDDLKLVTDRTGLRDAWRDALQADLQAQARARALRPGGPTAVTYFNNVRGRVSPLRYDHVYVSSEIEVHGLHHHYADAIGARSDHALVEVNLGLNTTRT